MALKQHYFLFDYSKIVYIVFIKFIIFMYVKYIVRAADYSEH